MPRGHFTYSDEQKAEYVQRKARGETHPDLCKEFGINIKTGQQWWSKHRYKTVARGTGMPAPKSQAEVNRSAISRRCLKDFAYFSLVVFGHTTSPWQADAAERIREAVESGRKEFILVNVFPGAGKTELLKRIVCWLIARDRTVRIIWGSASDELATLRVAQIQQELSRTEPGEGIEEDIASGRAVKPRFCMAYLFGRFKPSGHWHTTWSKSNFTVAKPGKGANEEGPPPPGPTLQAFGRKSRQLGPRGQFIVWDDAWTEDDEKNPETGKGTKRWLDKTAVNRLQTGGVFCVVMQRLSADDLSVHCRGKQRPVIDDEGRQVGYAPLYEHIVYPAHHADLCDGTHPKGRPAWDPKKPVMGNCITDPKALPPEDLLAAMQEPMFEVTHQQGDIDPSGALIPEVYLTGGKDENGYACKGCLDLDRGLWELPEGVAKSSLVCAMSVDVGQEGNWGLYVSATPKDPTAETEWILNADSRHMPAGTSKGLLDWDFERNCFVGVLEEWWQETDAAGLPFSVLVPEMNAAQRLLFREINVLDRWLMSRKVRILPHNTAKNKNDKKLGVESLVPMRYALGAYRLPWKPGPTQTQMRKLYNEAKGYGQGYPTQDIVMAQWMRSFNRRKLHRPVQAVPKQPEVPAYARRFA